MLCFKQAFLKHTLSATRVRAPGLLFGRSGVRYSNFSQRSSRRVTARHFSSTPFSSPLFFFLFSPSAFSRRTVLCISDVFHSLFHPPFRRCKFGECARVRQRRKCRSLQMRAFTRITRLSSALCIFPPCLFPPFLPAPSL